VLDLQRPDSALAAFLGPHLERTTFLSGDLTDPSFMQALDISGITHAVHAATLTHSAALETTEPERYLRINVDGLVNLLARLRRQPTLVRLVNISSGAVYGEPTPDSRPEPQDEDGPLNPSELYGVSKLAAEQIARRYGELFSLDVRQVRLSDVFGPMERPSPARSQMSVPYRILESIGDNRPLRLTANSLEGAGDFISAEDVAAGVLQLLTVEAFEPRVVNLALGRRVGLRELFEAVAAAKDMFRYDVVSPGEPVDVVLDPDNRRGRWNAYAIHRAERYLSWRPRPIDQQIRSYLDWGSGGVAHTGSPAADGVAHGSD